MRTIEVLPSSDFDQTAARRIVEAAALSIHLRGSCSLVLSGGNTPRTIFKEISRNHVSGLDWRKVRFFWGDERAVQPDDPASNFNMARETLFEPLGIPSDHIHRIRGELGSVAGAADYDSHLRIVLGGGMPMPRFDLVLLGLGEDGHTASLFPGDAALAEHEAWVAPSRSPVAPLDRITLSLPMLNSARMILMIATGVGKSPAFKRVLFGMSDRPPAALINPTEGMLHCLVDEPCSACLRGGLGVP